MSDGSSLRLRLRAVPTAAARLRRALTAFLDAFQVDEDVAGDIVTAVGEALANAIEHAYAATAPRDVTLIAEIDDAGRVIAQVLDAGAFIDRAERPGRGFGLRIVRSIASQVDLDTRNGTSLRMVFETQRKRA